MATREKKTPQTQQELPTAAAFEPEDATSNPSDEAAPRTAAPKKTAPKKAAPKEAAPTVAATAAEVSVPEHQPDEEPAAEVAPPTASHAQQTATKTAPAAQEPTMSAEIPFFGQAFEAAQTFWQQLVDRQVTALEGAIGQLEKLGQEQLERAQSHLGDSNRVAQDALAWLTELNTANARRAVEVVRAAAAMFPRRAA